MSGGKTLALHATEGTRMLYDDEIHRIRLTTLRREAEEDRLARLAARARRAKGRRRRPLARKRRWTG
ncbi:hypothetical protein GCM10009801_71090 [Streptomyces albiaxialis]|uniref:Uncharacterized protein n=1 Tax=Streptomyces albiaxialis TaxID=329523 RepID=A0ABN2WVJ8_9ACTN